MEWSDSGIVLSARRHGEHAAVVSLLTAHHGRHAGLVHGARGRRGRGLYQPGNTLAARWQARLPEHLGRYTCELVRARAGVLLDDPPRLAALAAVCALSDATLPERHPYPRVYTAALRLLDAIEAGERWAETVVRWELALLGELGFGLDLSACAADGGNAGPWPTCRPAAAAPCRGTRARPMRASCSRSRPSCCGRRAPPGTGMQPPPPISSQASGSRAGSWRSMCSQAKADACPPPASASSTACRQARNPKRPRPVL